MSAVLFQDGDWRICQNLIHGNEGTAIHHHCVSSLRNGLQDRWWHSTKGTKCLFCHESIPDAILGLWRLHEWDR